MRSSAFIAAASGLCLAVIAACGSSDRPPVTGQAIPASVSGGSGQPTFGNATGSLLPPGCGTEPDGTTCQCLDVPLFIDPPTIYFVLDRSGSMTTNDKWNQTRIVVGDIMRALGPRASFGAAYFPASGSSDLCAVGQEIMSVRAGDPPSSTADGPTTTQLLESTRVPASGGTPTAATLQLARSTLQRISGHKFIILATDGAPNCNPSAVCTAEQCQPNIEDAPSCPPTGPSCCEGSPRDCNDVDGSLSAINSLHEEGVTVYVVGLPGAASYAGLLDQMAVAGGAPQSGTPKYFAVDVASENVMLAALKRVAAQITGTCEYDLKETPANAAAVNVYLDDVVLPFEPVNGWTIEGAKVQLVGEACNKVKAGDVLNVRIITGCPRVEPR